MGAGKQGLSATARRGEATAQLPADPKMSRRHATVSFTGERFRIVDHDSQNGTFVDGSRVPKSLTSATARVMRTGDNLFLFCSDLTALQSQGCRRVFTHNFRAVSKRSSWSSIVPGNHAVAVAVSLGYVRNDSNLFTDVISCGGG